MTSYLDGETGLVNIIVLFGIFPLYACCGSWREENSYFQDVEASMVHLKLSFTITLFEWSCVLGPSIFHCIVDYIDSLSF